jgi:hypothetical protein
MLSPMSITPPPIPSAMYPPTGGLESPPYAATKGLEEFEFEFRDEKRATLPPKETAPPRLIKTIPAVDVADSACLASFLCCAAVTESTQVRAVSLPVPTSS